MQRPVLLSKHKSDPTQKVLKSRLLRCIEDAGSLSNGQHHFRGGFSTVSEVAVGEPLFETSSTVGYMDVKNALNLEKWDVILDTLENRFRM